jgi:hypothetical protein
MDINDWPQRAQNDAKKDGCRVGESEKVAWEMQSGKFNVKNGK